MKKKGFTLISKACKGFTLISKACKGFTLISKACKGFTLIELLVVISIIGILASLALVSYSGAQKQTRDTQRRSDLSQYHNGLETYAGSHNSTYPASLATIDALCNVLSPNFITSCPADPLTGIYAYGFFSSPIGNSYVIYGQLETGDYWEVCSVGKSGKVTGAPTDSDCDLPGESWPTIPVVEPTSPPVIPTSTLKNCWGIGGNCDTGCAASSVTTNTVYPNCNSSSCGGGNCWTTGGGCDSGCSAGSVSSSYVGSSCRSFDCGFYHDWAGGYDIEGTFLGCKESCMDWPYHLDPQPGDLSSCNWQDPRCHFCYANCGQIGYQASGNIGYKYSGSGSCIPGTPGVGCYKMTGGGTYYTSGALGDCGVSGCSSGTYYDGYVNCWWLGSTSSYSVGGSPVQAYQGGGSCNAGGTGSCYKLSGGSTYYTDGSGCGGGGCSGGTYYSSYQQCQRL